MFTNILSSNIGNKVTLLTWFNEVITGTLAYSDSPNFQFMLTNESSDNFYICMADIKHIDHNNRIITTIHTCTL